MSKKRKNLDIKALTEEQKTRKVVINTNTEHFWSSGMSCRDDDNQVMEIVDSSTTTFEVEGKWLTLYVTYDQSIASTKTKYIKLNTKTQFF